MSTIEVTCTNCSKQLPLQDFPLLKSIEGELVVFCCPRCWEEYKKDWEIEE